MLLLLLAACGTTDAEKPDTGDTAVGHDTDTDADTDADADTDTDADSDTDTDTDTDADSDTDTDSDTDADTDTDTGRDTGDTADTDSGADTADSGDTDTADSGDTDTADSGDTDTGDTGSTGTTTAVYDVELDADATWQGTSQWFGYELAPTGDIDGDGEADLLIASSYPSSSSGGGGSGRTTALSVVYGGSFAAGSYMATTIPEKWLDYARYDYDLRGDFDGDGYNEVAWLGYDGSGRSGVELLWGDGTRWTDGGYATADIMLRAYSPSYVGSNMAVGDADGDGLDDLIASVGSGATIVYGDTTRWTDSDLAANPTLSGASAWFGGGGVALGDLDGDGFDDIAIADVYDSMTGADQPGAVYVVYSDSRLTADLALPGDEDAVFRGPAGMGLVYMGYTLDVGDLDGDGFGELVAGAHSYDSGHGIAWVWEGETRWSGDYATTDAKGYVYGATASPLAVSIEMPGDIDGDGGKELFLGASNTGAYLFWGGTLTGALTDADAAVALTGGPADSRIGYMLSAGDLDADGVPDLVTSGYNAYGSSGDGVVWMVSGSGL